VGWKTNRTKKKENTAHIVCAHESRCCWKRRRRRRKLVLLFTTQSRRFDYGIESIDGRVEKRKKPCTRTVTIMTTATTPRGKSYCSACPPVLLLGQQIENDPEERREMWWEILLSNTLPL
jgi:hypothetical protein